MRKPLPEFILILLILLIIPGSLTGENHREQLGDVNDDGWINILDVISIVNLIVNDEIPPDEYQLWAADVNLDNTIDVLDIITIVNVVLGLDSISDFPRRVLFIGNSYTGYNGGLDTHVPELAWYFHPAWPLQFTGIIQGGATLEDHWNNPETLAAISGGDWDIVVLQEQSTRPLDDPELMMIYGQLLGAYIQDTGAETWLFMTWPREWAPETMDDIESRYLQLSSSIGNAPVVPVGRAWGISYSDDPDLNLYAGDGSHPNQHGTYLTACVFGTFLWRESMEGNNYVSSEDITPAESGFLQGIAWQTFQLYTPVSSGRDVKTGVRQNQAEKRYGKLNFPSN